MIIEHSIGRVRGGGGDTNNRMNIAVEVKEVYLIEKESEYSLVPMVLMTSRRRDTSSCVQVNHQSAVVQLKQASAARTESVWAGRMGDMRVTEANEKGMVRERRSARKRHTVHGSPTTKSTTQYHCCLSHGHFLEFA